MGPVSQARERRAARLHRVDRHPGDRHRAAQPRPVPGGRARRRRRQRRAARRPGARARRRGGRRRQGDRRAGPAARLLRRGRRSGATPPATSGSPRSWPGPTRWPSSPQWPADVVLNGVVGSLGLAPTLAALRAGRTLALANKESLIAGGPLVKAAVQRPGQIVPVDSEHSALAQCLRGGAPARGPPADPHRERRPVPRPAARGADRRHARARRSTHPTWNMGPVVTINSATHGQQGRSRSSRRTSCSTCPYDDIEVMVHPQSVIHSMVEFVDGSTIAQASPPDMRLPIALALGWPDRVPDAAPRRSTGPGRTPGSFEPLDDDRLPGGRAGQGRRDGRAHAGRRSTTPPTRSVWPRSRPVGCRSWASWTPSRGCSPRHPTSPNQVPSKTCWPRRPGRAIGHTRIDRGSGEGA